MKLSLTRIARLVGLTSVTRCLVVLKILAWASARGFREAAIRVEIEAGWFLELQVHLAW